MFEMLTNFRWLLDLLDILLVAFIIYRILLLIQGTRAESAAVKQEPDLPTTLADFLTQAKEEGKRGEMERESRVVVEEESMDRFEVLRPRIIWSLQTFRDIFLLIYSEAR